MNLSRAETIALELMNDHNLLDKGWTFKFDRAKKRFGHCSYGKRVISLSHDLTILNDEAEVRNTILHEIAHALVGSHHGHDYMWRNTARSIGCTGDRCYSSEVTTVPKTFIGECPNGHRIERFRRSNGSCAKCSPGVYDSRFLFKWRYK